MTREDVNKLFDEFLRVYFPNSRKIDDPKVRSSWFFLLEPYSPKVVKKATISVLRTSQYLPDPQKVSIRCEALEPAPEPSAPPEQAKKPRQNLAWMLPYIRKNICLQTDAEADEIHAAGLLTWREAEAAGMDFREWNRAYREKFPVGGGP